MACHLSSAALAQTACHGLHIVPKCRRKEKARQEERRAHLSDEPDGLEGYLAANNDLPAGLVRTALEGDGTGNIITCLHVSEAGGA
jgi:hypothetical protein